MSNNSEKNAVDPIEHDLPVSENVQCTEEGNDEDKPRKKYKFKAGTRSIREIRKLQKSTDTIIPRAAFSRLVREIAQEFKHDLRFKGTAIDALQAAAEDYLVRVMADSQLVAMNDQRTGIMQRDMKLANYLANPH